jgi:site-specific recombinase XerD
MADAALIGPWVRRFLLEHLVGERNLSINTQRSYRDMLLQLLPFLATHARKPVERLTVTDLSAKRVISQPARADPSLQPQDSQSAPQRDSRSGEICRGTRA